MCQFLNKWKSEEAEAHPSQTSQKSLAWEFHFCPLTRFSLSVAFLLSPLFPNFFTACHLFLNTTLLSHGTKNQPKCKMHNYLPISFAFTPFRLAQAKKAYSTYVSYM